MPVYVDPLMHLGWRPRWARGKTIPSCHMFTDGDLDELHRLAKAIGMQRSWFQWEDGKVPHYDLTEAKRKAAIRRGAIPLDLRGTVAKWKELRAAGKFRKELSRNYLSKEKYP